MAEDQRIGNAKQLNEPDESIHGSVSTGNLERIPIKKRKFFLRSPSPPPPPPPPPPLSQSKLDCSKGNVVGQGSSSVENTQPQVTCSISNSSALKKAASDRITKRTMGFRRGPRGTVRDGGSVILALPACSRPSGQSHTSISDGLQKAWGGSGKRNKRKSSALHANGNKTAKKWRSTMYFGKNIFQGEGCVGVLPSANIPSVLKSSKTQIQEVAKTKPNILCVSSSGVNGSNNCRGLLESLKMNVPVVEESPSDFPSGSNVGSCGGNGSNNCRGLLESLRMNVPVVEESPSDFPSGSNVSSSGGNGSNNGRGLLESLRMNVPVVEKSPSDFRSGYNVGSSGGNGSNDCHGLLESHRMNVPVEESLSDFPSGSNVGAHITLETSSVSRYKFLWDLNTVMDESRDPPDHTVVDSGMLSSGAPFANSQNIEKDTASEPLQQSLVIESAQSGNGFITQIAKPIVQPQMHEVKLFGSNLCEVRGADFDFNGLDGAARSSQSLPKNFHGLEKRCIGGNDLLIRESVDCKDTNKECEYPVMSELKNSADGNLSQIAEADMSVELESHPSVAEGLNESVGSHHSSKLEETVAPSSTTVTHQVEDSAISNELKGDSIRDDLVEIGCSVPETVMSEGSTGNPMNQFEANNLENPREGGYGSPLSNREFSQLTETVTKVPNTIGVYDSALDEVELRESEKHCRENRKGEGLAGQYKKQSFLSDYFSSTTFPEEAEGTKHESPVQKSCSGIQPMGIDIGNVDVALKELKRDAQCNGRSASVSGGELQVPDKSADLIRRSRLRDLDIMRPQSSLQTDQAGGQSCSVEMRALVAENGKDGEGMSRVSEDKSTRARLTSRIPTSKSEDPRNRGSRGERACRGSREEYCRPVMYNGGISTGIMLNDIGTRERSFSPYSRFSPMNDSGSREESFSPIERSRFSHISRTSIESRSPVHRSEARMGRARGRRGRGSWRGRGSPVYRSEARMGRARGRRGRGSWRGRRSPVRVFNQRQRFDAVGSPERSRTDDYMRPMNRPARFHDSTVAGSGDGYYDNDHYSREPLRITSQSRSRSNSPGFMTNARMLPRRPPYQRSADHFRGRRSPARGIYPCQGYANQRSNSPGFMTDARMLPRRPSYQQSADHFRGRRSPGRGIYPCQGYTNQRSPGRLHSDDGMRPMTQPGNNFRRN